MLSKQNAGLTFGASPHNGRALADELLLEEWGNGLVLWLGAFVRVRQIRLANPGLATGLRPQAVREPPTRGNTGLSF